MIVAKPARAELPEALGVLADAGRAVAAGEPLQPTLATIAEAVALATSAELVVVSLRERGDELVARTVWSASAALGAEIEGLRSTGAGTPGVGATAEVLRKRLGPGAIAFGLPLTTAERDIGSLDILRRGDELDLAEQRLAALAADLASLATQFCSDGRGGPLETTLLDLAGDALAAVSDEQRTGAHVARLGAIAARADAALLWRLTPAGFERSGSYGSLRETVSVVDAAQAIVGGRDATAIDETPEGVLVTLQLGQPPAGALQLLYSASRAPESLAPLESFAVRVAHALRAAERSSELALELERSRALLAVVGEAIARLSLAHTLETAVERVAALLDTDRVALYLEEEGVLSAAATRAIEGPHEPVARAVLELAMGPRRGHGIVELDARNAVEQLAVVRDEAAEAQITSVLALPLLVQDGLIGLLAVYPRRQRELTPNESALLVALAAQLAVAVQNARLHERAKELGGRLETALASEREAARRLRTLYEIAGTFAQSLSLQTTLDVLARSIVTLLGVDAAVIRMPDERGLDYVAHAVEVNDQRVNAAARALLQRPQPLSREQRQDLLDRRGPLLLDARSATAFEGAIALLSPFLERGSSAAIVPIESAGDLLAMLTIVSLHPERPVAGEADTAFTITGQAALAIDNARLYGQQKEFSDTMQRSLLPREVPHLERFEIGDVYESAARVDVGGDVYDYLVLPDGRLAVVLGDVTGHGIEATADMAMAKFVFRSLARVHVDPGAFLAAANEVVTSDIAPGKFITMVELVLDADAGTVTCASAGHPAPRLVLPDGSVQAIAARGLALGIDAAQTYEPVSLDYPAGASVVLYTDGVVEARRNGEQFGGERLDALLAERHGLPAKELAAAALAACREWTDGELTDDVALVVIKRSR
ncbi:MAG: SpoIIE family protein phosphatase [Gaiellaceae bacterium MAG52_C11]|nr:SpoIIE family protein phosphatase [Candidatus Gaiellasilicea maunaloa]